MILSSQLTAIGRTIKPHGINGEISAAIDGGVDLDALRCIVLDIDGINVPFFIEKWRPRGVEAVLMTIDGVRSDSEAQRLCPMTVYALTDDLGETGCEEGDGLYADDLAGFTVVDPEGRQIGLITDVDTSTPNTLFIVTDPRDNVIYIPVADEFIVAMDPEAKTITMDLPTGLPGL